MPSRPGSLLTQTDVITRRSELGFGSGSSLHSGFDDRMPFFLFVPPRSGSCEFRTMRGT